MSHDTAELKEQFENEYERDDDYDELRADNTCFMGSC